MIRNEKLDKEGDILIALFVSLSYERLIYVPGIHLLWIPEESILSLIWASNLQPPPQHLVRQCGANEGGGEALQRLGLQVLVFSPCNYLCYSYDYPALVSRSILFAGLGLIYPKRL
jgi:hypothetical protein